MSSAENIAARIGEGLAPFRSLCGQPMSLLTRQGAADKAVRKLVGAQFGTLRRQDRRTVHQFMSDLDRLLRVPKVQLFRPPTVNWSPLISSFELRGIGI